jgi:hypothetical protein
MGIEQHSPRWRCRKPPAENRRLCFSAKHPPRPEHAMGFLDDLKRQADALKSQHNIDEAALARNTAQTPPASRRISTGWN